MLGNRLVKNKSSLSFLCLLGLLASCGEAPKSLALMREVEARGWSRRDSFSFDMPVRDSLSLYHIDIVGRLRNTYLHDSLRVILHVSAPSGEWFRDTVRLSLTHDHDRLWEDFRFAYCSRVRFTQTGVWRFDLWHYMDAEILKGVSAIGLYVKRERNGKK